MTLETPKKNKTFTVLVRAPRTCVTKLEVSAPDKRSALKRAVDIIKFNEQPVEWEHTLPFTSMGIHTEVLQTCSSQQPCDQVTT